MEITLNRTTRRRNRERTISYVLGMVVCNRISSACSVQRNLFRLRKVGDWCRCEFCIFSLSHRTLNSLTRDPKQTSLHLNFKGIRNEMALSVSIRQRESANALFLLRGEKRKKQD